MEWFCRWMGAAAGSDCAAWAQAWSGWAQALGALAAIALTAYIASEGHRREERRRAHDRAERTTREAIAAAMFAEHLLDVTRGMMIGCANQQEEVISRFSNVLSEALIWARTINLTDLPQEGAKQLALLRGIAAETLSKDVIGSHISFAHRGSFLQGIEVRILEHKGKLKAAVGVA